MHPYAEHGRRHEPRRHHEPGERGMRSGHQRRYGGGRGRAPRGDVRAAVLLLLSEEPMHGYQLMQTIADRSGGRWTPSPGAIYPTLSQLEDEGLVAVTAESGRKLATLSDAGRRYVEENSPAWPEPFTTEADAGGGPDLRGLLMELHAAARQVGRAGSEAQRAAAAEILTGA